MTRQAKSSRRPGHGIETPLLTVDSVLFTYHERALKLLLVRRSSEPEKGKWGLPGGIVDIDIDDDVEATARRKLVEKTSVEPPYLDQLETIGNRERDPRGWSVTVCYTALIAHQACAQHVSTVSDVRWVELDAALKMKLAFDHHKIIGIARERQRQRALYSISSGYALAEEFTLAELQHLHELLIGKPIQKRSFRRRIEQAKLLIDTGRKRQEGGRPAALYRMKPESITYRFVRNLEAS
ncbi:MAG: NUDIX domain-containing protein [Gammaproteobacteria bacterium]|nr:NUDIX domain-containing protein [Gammaproteobacteria bacterium]